MPLDEGEIVRYSRQILLREVGGRGQERLLESAVELGPGGAALSTAAAYIAASGIRVLGGRRWSSVGEAGFLVGLANAPSLADRRRGRAQPSQSSVWVAEAPTGVPEGERGRVLMGGSGSAAWIVFGSAATDVRLVRAAAPKGQVPVELAEATGALAALLVQRLILQLGDPSGRLRIDPSCAVELVAFGPST